MDPQTAYERRADVTFLDVREPFEWDAGHVEGALHVPLSQIPFSLDQLPSDGPIITVCTVGARSDMAAQFLQQNGFDASNMDGGLATWVERDLPLVADGGSPGRLVH